MYILGLNAFHGDSSACLFKDGVLIAAAEEERFRRIKHWAGFPSQSIKHCLRHASIQLCDVEHIAINQDSSANLWNKIGYTLSKKPEIKFVINKLKNKKRRDFGFRFNFCLIYCFYCGFYLDFVWCASAN